jgi:hypothetical protein
VSVFPAAEITAGVLALKARALDIIAAICRVHQLAERRSTLLILGVERGIFTSFIPLASSQNSNAELECLH